MSVAYVIPRHITTSSKLICRPYVTREQPKFMGNASSLYASPPIRTGPTALEQARSNLSYWEEELQAVLFETRNERALLCCFLLGMGDPDSACFALLVVPPRLGKVASAYRITNSCSSRHFWIVMSRIDRTRSEVKCRPTGRIFPILCPTTPLELQEHPHPINRVSGFLSSFRIGIGAEKHHLILPDYYRSRESTEHKSRTSQRSMAK